MVATKLISGPDHDATQRYLREILQLFASSLEIDASEIDPSSSFIEMGGDSLSLLDAQRQLHERYGVKIGLRAMIEEIRDFKGLAAYLAARANQTSAPRAAAPVPDAAPASRATIPDPDAAPESTVAPAPRAAPVLAATPALAPRAPPPPMMSAAAVIAGAFPPPVSTVSFAPIGDSLEALLARQLEVFERMTQQQLALLAGHPAATLDVRPAISAAAPVAPAAPVALVAPAAPAPAPLELRPVGLDKKPAIGGIDRGRKSPEELRDQKAYIDAFVARYVARTRHSKEMAQAHRRHLADKRGSSNFRFVTKELVYPIAAARSQGSRFWDVDGNEYVDLAMGFGTNLFGHRAPFIMEAIEAQLARGMHVGPQSDCAGEVARLICDLTGMERASFNVSGSEAVMTAMRLARMRTGRAKIAIFNNSYHGIYDGTLVGPAGGGATGASVPLVPGITQNVANDILVLDYGDARSLEIIQQHASELAAVMLEPLQSRRPSVFPADFVKQLRTLTRDLGIALIFDEVLCGFRVHPAGAQALFQVKPDIVTYGKILGAGLPIGVVAGSAEYLDGIDGGFWQYGDDSFPAAEVTFVGGTYVKQPLSMAVAHAVLTRLKQEGPAFQERLNRKTDRLVARLNRVFEEFGVPIHVEHFGSLFRFMFEQNMDLFFYGLIEKGVYLWEQRVCFLSEAHSKEDLDFVVDAARSVARTMRDAHFFGGPSPAGPGGGASGGSSAESEAGGSGGLSARPGAGASGGRLRSAAGAIPLSPIQEQIWFLSKRDEASAGAYNDAVVLRIRRAIDHGGLARAFSELIVRHDALRAGFDPSGEIQIVHECASIEVGTTDLSDQPADQRERMWRQLAHAESVRPFDLERPPPLRAHLIKLAPDEHLLVLVVNDIAVDGISMGILVAEVHELYAAQVESRSPSLPAPARLEDFIRATRRWMGSEQAEDARRYWSETLARENLSCDLPADRDRGSEIRLSGGRERVTLSPEVRLRLLDVARASGSTLFNVLFAGFGVLMHRLCASAEVTLGVRIAQRAFADAERLVANTTNLLPIVSTAAPEATFERYLLQLRGRCLESFEHQLYPFPAMVRALNPVRRGLRDAICNVVFNLDQERSTRDLSKQLFTVVDFPLARGRLDLEANVTEYREELRIDFEYDALMFARESVRSWLELYETILTRIANGENTSVEQIGRISEDSFSGLVQGSIRAEQEDASFERRLADSFRRHAARPAVDGPDQPAWTYAELDAHTERLADRLAALGAGPGVLVGIDMPRSPEMLAAILAVLRVGSAFVPIDPSWPEARLGLVLDDTGAPIVIVRDRTDRYRRFDVVTLDVLEEASNVPRPNLVSAIDERELAYAIYTSGSTGAPKAALIERRGMLNHLLAKIEDLALGPEDVIAQSASQCFDVSIWQFLAASLAGARVRIVVDAVVRHPRRLVSELQDARVTVFETVPSLLGVLLDEELPASGGWALRWLMSTGEALSPDLCRRWIEAQPGIPVMNAYGPTECSDDVTHQVIRGAAELNVERVAIGRPVRNTLAAIFDAKGRPVPQGAWGELWIGGSGVGRGYLNRREKTSEVFVPTPFDAGGSSRAYRTGDVVRLRPGGSFEMMGRRDHQVKIRGHRIELGEIEAALARLPGVREVVAVVREDREHDRKIVAYYSERDGAVGPEALRDALLGELPEYMVPALFVRLQDLPRTNTGKVDRSALPAPHEDGFVGRPSEAPLGSETETRLAALWSELLGVPRVGPNDNFFELGGDSILSIRLVNRARPLGIDLTPDLVFEHQTPRALAVAVGHASPPLWLARDETGVAPLAPFQAWFAGRVDDLVPWTQTCVAVPSERLDPDRLERALAAVVAHHPALRTGFERRGDGWVQRVQAAAGPVSLIRIPPGPQGSIHAEARVESVTSELSAALDARRPPQIRAAWMDAPSAKDCRLLMVVHHLAIDGMSWTTLLGDLATSYRALGETCAPELAPETTTFATWCHALQSRAATADAERRAREWWAARGAPAPRLERDGRAEDGGRRSRVTTRLDRARSNALLHTLPARHQIRTDEVLVAAVADGLRESTGRAQQCFDVELHGRDLLGGQVDVGRTIGLFTHVVRVVLEVPGEVAGASRVAAAREALRGDPEAARDYAIVRHLSPRAELREELSRNADCDICFNYMGSVENLCEGANPIVAQAEFNWSRSSPGDRAGYPLEVECSVRAGQFETIWLFDVGDFRNETVEKMAASCQAALEARIDEYADATYLPVRHPGCEFLIEDSAQAKRLFELVARTRPDCENGSDGPLGGVEMIGRLTSLQSGILFQCLTAKEHDRYFQSLQVRLRGSLDGTALRAAIAATGARHQALRTSFAWDGLDRPLQIVHRDVPAEIAELDFRGLGDAQVDRALQRLIRSDRRRGFEPARPPLWRVTLAAGPGDRWDLVWSIHHLLLDGWSMAGVLAEVLRDYASIRQGGTAAPRGPQVGDYLAWSADHPPPDGAEHFARDLAGCYEEPAHWRWPESRESGDVDPFGEIAFSLDARETGALDRVARDERLTISTIMCGAWSLVLAERQRRERVVIGVTTSGREAEVPGLEEMVGVFINTLPVSVQPEAERPAAEWLRTLQSKLAQVRKYERCDLSDIRRWAGVRGDAPLFESAVIVDTYPIDLVAGTSVEGIDIEDVRFVAPGGLPVVLKVNPTDTLRVVIKYDRRSVGEDEARGYSEDLSRLLRGFAEDPSRALRDLGRAPAGSGARPVLAPRVRLTHVAAAIAEAAARYPEATAVRDGERALSYRALDQMSDAIAAFLIDRGVERDTLVALCMERSAHYPAAILGVWKAGGAFVPIEMGLPPDRLHSLLAADALSMALADTASLEKVRPAPLPVFALQDAIGTEARVVRREFDPASLAYCVFTSGSTGTPKAVAVEHAQLAHYTGAACAALGVAPGDELACVTTLAADLGYTMLFPALASGACVTVIDERDALDPWKLARRFAANPVDHLKIVPTHLAAWLAEDVGRQLMPARTLVLGGETFPWELRDRLIGLDLGCRILNHYGPTETTIGVVCGPADDADRETCPSVPLGLPLGEARLRLSDEAAAPNRRATDGELQISGPCVARGYLDLPELNRERFGADTTEGRSYRTGDRVRRLADGRLVFLGRDDDQVKIRGHRVELGDVESCLRALPGVAQAAVLLERSELGDARLAAFVAGDSLSAESIRAQLERKLPAVMVPGRLSVLPHLPVTPNGKVDRRALLSTLTGGIAARENDRADDVEGRVHAIWQGLFPGKEVVRDANFYELGGQSLLALRMVSRIRRELDVELPVSAIFDKPTIGALVRYIHELGTRGGSERAAGEGDQGAGGSDRVYRLSPTQAEIWKAAQRDLRFDQSQTTLELRGPLERSAFEAALRAVVSHHPVLRTSFERGPDGAPLQRVHTRVPVELEWEDWREATSEEQERRWHELVRGNETIGFDLEAAPLFRLTVLRIAEDLYWAHWHVHHILSDGWSTDVVCTDLLACYEAIRRGDEVPLAEWPGFERYVEWLGSADAAEAELFWRKRLAGLEPLALTTIDVARVPSDADATYAEHFDRLDELTRDDLRRCAQALHVTPSTLVHASWALALHGLAGRDDVVFGTVTAGRPPDLRDVERIVGPFLAATPFRVVIDREAPVSEWLRAIHEELLRTVRFGFVEHRSLRAWAGREEGAALADSLLVVQGSHHAAVLRHTGSLRVERVRSPWGRTQSALFVEVVPDSGEVTAVWRTDRFREQTVVKLLELHQRALSHLLSLARDPGSRLASILER